MYTSQALPRYLGIDGTCYDLCNLTTYQKHLGYLCEYNCKDGPADGPVLEITDYDCPMDKTRRGYVSSR